MLRFHISGLSDFTLYLKSAMSAQWRPGHSIWIGTLIKAKWEGQGSNDKAKRPKVFHAECARTCLCGEYAVVHHVCLAP